MDSAEVEQRKDNFDLRRELLFVAENLKQYTTALKRLSSLPVNREPSQLLSSLSFLDIDCSRGPQLGPEDIRDMLSRMPEALSGASKLGSVAYSSMIPLPKFDERGIFNGNAEWVEYEEFPRQGDHPYRILIGVSDGSRITLTPIPRRVSDNFQAGVIYQNHVFLHEFFHTLDYPRRNPETRNKLVFSSDGREFTFQDFWGEFSDICLKPGCTPVSMYAASRFPELAANERGSEGFDSALGEQICESFVGYLMGILPNERGDTDFRATHPREHRLIDKIYHAKLVRAD